MMNRIYIHAANSGDISIIEQKVNEYYHAIKISINNYMNILLINHSYEFIF